MKIIVVIAIIAILASLFSSLFFMLKGDQSTAMVRTLTWRVALSLLLFIFLLVGFYVGWFQPHQPF